MYPPERKRRCEAQIKVSELEKAESDVLATTEEQKWYKKELLQSAIQITFLFPRLIIGLNKQIWRQSINTWGLTEHFSLV